MSISLLFTIFSVSATIWNSNNSAAAAAVQEILRGFEASPNPQSPSPFQPLLTDSTHNFSLGFLRVNTRRFSIAVVHLPSFEPLWSPNVSFANLPPDSVHITFDGSLVVSNHDSGVLWSTSTNGDRLLLLGDSNLQILKGRSTVLWESFSFPGDTLVQNQNFTANMSLLSSNRLYTMRLGDKFIGLYARLGETYYEQMYWRHGALQARAAVVPGKGPIYTRVSEDGFLGMYQTEEAPIDVEAFDNFQRSSGQFLRLRLEQDGNLKAYCWYDSQWLQVYVGIKSSCDLPNRCGSYGICDVDGGCSCMVDRRGGGDGRCSAVEAGNNICHGNGGGGEFKVIREAGVELPFKEMMEFEKMSSIAECEGACEKNCSCWGAVYNNGSGSCYLVWYPIQTLLRVGNEDKVGYFKVREVGGEGGIRMTVGVKVGLLFFLAAACGGGLFCFGCIVWRRKGGRKNGAAVEAEAWPGPYKTLAAPTTPPSMVELGGGRG